MKKPIFISIGDTVVDAFIKLNNETKVEIKDNRISMPFGQKVPFEYAKEIAGVGNSANAAVSFARLGLESYLITNVGDDENGKKSINALEKDNVKSDFIKINNGINTNYHYVLWYGHERTILIKHEKYEYSFPEIQNIDLDENVWIYLSSLGDHTEEYHNEIISFLEQNEKVNLIFQPGTFQMKLGVEKLKGLYQRCNLFYCNLEEAQMILKTDTKDINELLNGFVNIGVKTPIITDGPNGAHALYNGEVISCPMFPDIAEPLERTGCGDAFASTSAAAIAMGLDINTALKMGAINSMNVCQHVGAQEGLLTMEEINKYLNS